MIKVRKGMVLAIVLAAVVIAGSMGMRAGRADPVDAIECGTDVINEKEDVDTPKMRLHLMMDRILTIRSSFWTG